MQVNYQKEDIIIKMENKIEPKKGFVWYGLRWGFWIMVTLLILSIIIGSYYNIDPWGYYDTNKQGEDLVFALQVVYLLTIPFNFILSIIHLYKYKEKKLAIIVLIWTSIVLLAQYEIIKNQILMDQYFNDFARETITKQYSPK